MQSAFASGTVSDLKSRTLWYVRLRWFILLLVVGPSLIASFYDVGLSARFLRDLIFCSVMFASNGVFQILAHRVHAPSRVRALAYAITLTDVVFVTFFLYSKGGIESRSVILFMLPIIASAAILGRVGAYLAAGLSITGYTFIILGAYGGLLGMPMSQFTPGLDNDFGYVLNTVIYFDFVLAMAALGIDYMTRLLIQKEHEAAVRLADLKQTQLIAKVGAWEYIVASGTIVYSDELYAIERHVLPAQVVTIEQFSELVHPDDRAMLQRKLRSALKKPCSVSLEHRMLSPDGVIQYMHLDGQSVAGKDGKVERIVGSARDVTEERALAKARNDFVALASHQLRTPATIVKQYVALVRDGYAGAISDDQAKFLQAAYDNNERQIKIVNDLLNVARIDADAYRIHRSRVDLVALLSTIVSDQSAKFGDKDQPLTLDTARNELFAYVDADGLRMAVDNLLDNAHKYTPEGKRVRVGLVKKAGSAVITVTDRGVGIAATDLPKMFKMFSRIENPLTLQQEGTGLGLYWAQRIIKLHKGKIAVSSTAGRGTTFSITLPLGSVKA